MQTIASDYDTVFLFRSFRGNNMSTEYNPKIAGPRLKTSPRKSGNVAPGSETSALGSKTLGPRSSALWVELNERGKTTFSLRDVEEITGLRGSSARTLIHKAERRGEWKLGCVGSVLPAVQEPRSETSFVSCSIMP